MTGLSVKSSFTVDTSCSNGVNKRRSLLLAEKKLFLCIYEFVGPTVVKFSSKKSVVYSNSQLHYFRCSVALLVLGVFALQFLSSPSPVGMSKH